MLTRELIEGTVQESDRDYHQELSDRAYARWQKDGDLNGKSLEDFLSSLEDPYRLAVVFGQANHQIGNGGMLQWIDNGYADVGIPYLKEYIKAYGDEYPALLKFGEILDRLERDFEEANDGGEFETLKDWVDRDIQAELEMAIHEEDWRAVDELLGGTYLDHRKYNSLIVDAIRSSIVVKTSPGRDRGEALDHAHKLLAGEGGRWSFRLTDDNSGDTVYDSADEDEFFDSEELAREAGEDRLDAVELSDLSNASDIEDEVKAELVREYSSYVDSNDDLERLSSAYFKISEELRVELERLLNTEFPDGPIDRAMAYLKRAWDSVRQHVSGVQQKVTGKVAGIASKFSRAAKAAKHEFSKEESREAAKRLVDQLLEG